MAKHDRKGRSKSNLKFIQLFWWMLDSPAWDSLSANERSVYLVLERRFTGFNNGNIALGVRDAAKQARVNKDTASTCLATLVERGFIECVTPGGFSRKTPHATEWRLTVHECHRTNQPAKKTFMRWRAENLERGPKPGDSRSETKGQEDAKPTATVPRFRTDEAA